MLTSIKNPLIKQLRKLHRSRERQKQNLLLLEGTNLLTAACQVNYELITVCCTPKWQQNHPQLWQKIFQQALKTELVSPEVLDAIATTINPDGIVATAVRKVPQRLTQEKISLGLVLERLQDPGNLGTIIRTAVATNVDGIWLSQDSVDFDNPKVLRASVGEWFKLPMIVSQNLAEEIKQLKQQGNQIIATLPQATMTYWEIDFHRPTVILLGNEGAGLSEELIGLADCQVTIPLSNQVESLNVAITSALLLYEAQRQHQSYIF
ncbi:tRNA/rRNA methyltransferase (SpoU) [Stanieria cyanosphaera PCC 7437]|uniref:tRNA/rRNA methyltransferase (SpoU) n=1 Tax=Stanieria cyanosphaera (strain ATCC 29371 / PCC 7437) TaxID=111780 RepID=K9XZF4_STAC7|nr:RNA methyltransferase [Stanieria cyanosphaera]AFZ37908.1 tRNA/rRNA methyltransferase (SpoU) [Stanieria cyanosphaera PCC 7437]